MAKIRNNFIREMKVEQLLKLEESLQSPIDSNEVFKIAANAIIESYQHFTMFKKVTQMYEEKTGVPMNEVFQGKDLFEIEAEAERELKLAWIKKLEEKGTLDEAKSNKLKDLAEKLYTYKEDSQEKKEGN